MLDISVRTGTRSTVTTRSLAGSMGISSTSAGVHGHGHHQEAHLPKDVPPLSCDHSDIPRAMEWNRHSSVHRCWHQLPAASPPPPDDLPRMPRAMGSHHCSLGYRCWLQLPAASPPLPDD